MNPLADFTQQITVPMDPAPQAMEILTQLQQLMDGRLAALHDCHTSDPGLVVAFAPILVKVVADIAFFDVDPGGPNALHLVLWDLIVRGRAVALPVTICVLASADPLHTVGQVRP